MRFGNLAGLLMKRLGPPVVRLEHVVADVADECASGAGHGGQSAASTGQRQEKSRMSPFAVRFARFAMEDVTLLVWLYA